MIFCLESVFFQRPLLCFASVWRFSHGRLCCLRPSGKGRPLEEAACCFGLDRTSSDISLSLLKATTATQFTAIFSAHQGCFCVLHVGSRATSGHLLLATSSQERSPQFPNRNSNVFLLQCSLCCAPLLVSTRFSNCVFT